MVCINGVEFKTLTVKEIECDNCEKPNSSRYFVSYFDDNKYESPVGISNGDMVKGYIIAMKTLAYNMGIKFYLKELE